MPISTTTIFINFSWETASIVLSTINGLGFSQANFIRFSWFFFDILIILLLYVKNKEKTAFKKYFVFYTLFCLFLSTFFFLCFTKFKYGMVISAFIIDAHMEVLFWKNRKKLDPSNRLIIGIFKILGDIFAGLYYSVNQPIVLILAIVACVFDVMYIAYAIKEKKDNPEISAHFNNELNLFMKHLENKLLPRKAYQRKRTYKKKQKNKKTHRKK